MSQQYLEHGGISKECKDLFSHVAIWSFVGLVVYPKRLPLQPQVRFLKLFKFDMMGQEKLWR